MKLLKRTLGDQNVKRARRHLLRLAWKDTHQGDFSRHPYKDHLQGRKPDMTLGDEIQPCVLMELKIQEDGLDSKPSKMARWCASTFHDTCLLPRLEIAHPSSLFFCLSCSAVAGLPLSVATLLEARAEKGLFGRIQWSSSADFCHHMASERARRHQAEA